MAKLNLKQSGAWIGMAGLSVTLFLYGYSAVVVRDAWSLVVLPVVWIVLFVLACLWFMKHPYRVLVLPVVAAVLWFAVILTQANT